MGRRAQTVRACSVSRKYSALLMCGGIRRAGAQVISTHMNYKLITRDMERSMDRVENQPLVKRDTEYFLANIGKITSAEELVNDYRLFNYAMKAHGLQDMAYAKAFMLKALEGGVSDPDSFANKLSDKRYAQFVADFNFVANGEKTTTYNLARDATVDNYINRATGSGVLPQTETVKKETAYYQENIGAVESIEDLLADERLLEYALRAFSIEDLELTKTELSNILLGGVSEPDSLANKHSDANVAKFVTAFNFAELGEETTSYVASQNKVTAQYLRQTLEEDAGLENEGVRLALYFERKAPDIKSFYDVLADAALGEVVRTALGLPASSAQADLDKQVQAFEKRLSLEDFTDPAKLTKFLARFTVMWDVTNAPAASSSPAVSLISQPAQLGISVDTMMAIARLKS
ncbi:DUF1217 domain-containing protein [Mesorhizobium sp. CAU 1741]|uniref:DUF1217 domain-containing protein n=1 Tax=Mesorhizobium sp. CAU 1741 TaxID=3140366 RepID=UPI00325C0CC0